MHNGAMQQPGSAPSGVPERERTDVPRGLRTGAAWSWRLLVIVGVIAVFIALVITFRVVVIPFLISLLLASVLVPFSEWLQRHRWPRWLAILVAFLGALAVLGGLVALIVWQVRGGFADLWDKTLASVDEISGWLASAPFYYEVGDLSDRISAWWSSFQQDEAFWDRVLSLGSTAGHVAAGLLLTLFATLFLLIDGPGIWRWVLSLFPHRARPAVEGAAAAGWSTLSTFTRIQVFVAAVDAIGIGLGAWILGLFFGGFPLVIPLAIAVFLASFIPFVGALFTGAFAVLVALVYLGPLPAIIMLAIVLIVQQVEGHVLQPLVMGTAVKVHPLAVVFGVAAGSLVAGIPGALFAVPLIAVTNAVVRHIAGRAPSGAEVGTSPETPRDDPGALTTVSSEPPATVQDGIVHGADKQEDGR